MLKRWRQGWRARQQRPKRLKAHRDLQNKLTVTRMTAATMRSKKKSTFLWPCGHAENSVPSNIFQLSWLTDRRFVNKEHCWFVQGDHKNEAGPRCWWAAWGWWRLLGGSCGEHQWVHGTFRIPQDFNPSNHSYSTLSNGLTMHRGWRINSNCWWNCSRSKCISVVSVLSVCAFSCSPGKKARILDAEGLALGCEIATSKKKTRDLVDGSFHRSGPLVH